MAHIARIIDDTGAVLKDLNVSAAVGFAALDQGIPDRRIVDVMRAGRDVERVQAEYGLTLAQVELLIAGADGDTMQNHARDISRCIQDAILRQKRRAGRRIFFEHQRDGTTVPFRTEILDGDPAWDAFAVNDHWAAYLVEALLPFARRPYWEASAETELPLYNTSQSPGTYITGGLTIYNHDDATAGHDNWGEVQAVNVLGDLPTPFRLEFTNTYNNASRMKPLWVGDNFASDPANLTHILEAEAAAAGPAPAATPATTGGTATASGDSYVTYTWSGATEVSLADWTLSSAQLGYMANAEFRILAKFFTGPAYSDMYVRFKVLFASANADPLWVGPLVRLAPTTDLQELTTVRLPPDNVLVTSRYPLNLVMYAYRPVAAAHALALDYLELMALDGYLKLTPKGLGLAYNAKLVVDGMSGETYTESGGQRWTGYKRDGRAMLYPNKLQRLYFSWLGDAQAAEIARTAAVRVYYRQRRLLI